MQVSMNTRESTTILNQWKCTRTIYFIHTHTQNGIFINFLLFIAGLTIPDKNEITQAKFMSNLNFILRMLQFETFYAAMLMFFLHLQIPFNLFIIMPPAPRYKQTVTDQ